MSIAGLSTIYTLLSGFCLSGYDFAIPSFRLYLAIQTLGVAIEFVSNYAPVDFHHRPTASPLYNKKSSRILVEVAALCD